jgi:hypothetical protein
MILFSSFPQVKLLCALLVQVILVHSSTDTVTFNYNGAIQSWTVPFNVHSLHVVVKGAEGGNGQSAGTPGKGGIVVCDLAVTMGTLVYLLVGGKGSTGGGSNSNADRNGGWNGGGAGWGAGSGGGGASDIRIGGTDVGDRKVVAGGGGGIYGAGNCGGNPQPTGGNGGTPFGTAGSNRCTGGAVGGGGGWIFDGGGAAGGGGATAGVLGFGGRADHDHDDDAPGGGGGFYGGK